MCVGCLKCGLADKELIGCDHCWYYGFHNGCEKDGVELVNVPGELWYCSDDCRTAAAAAAAAAKEGAAAAAKAMAVANRTGANKRASTNTNVMVTLPLSSGEDSELQAHLPNKRRAASSRSGIVGGDAWAMEIVQMIKASDETAALEAQAQIESSQVTERLRLTGIDVHAKATAADAQLTASMASSAKFTDECKEKEAEQCMDLLRLIERNKLEIQVLEEELKQLEAPLPAVAKPPQLEEQQLPCHRGLSPS